MKIFLSGSFDEDSFADNVQHTLTLMGHQVFTSETAKNHKLFGSSLLFRGEQIAREQGMWGFERKILSKIRLVKPDLFFSVTQVYSPRFLEELDRLVKIKVMWWGDPIGLDRRMTLLSKSWSAIFLKDLLAVQKLRIIGRPCFLLDEAMNPAWHKPLSGQENAAIIVAGNYYNYRQAICELLFEKGYQLDLYGFKPPMWALPIIKSNYKEKYIAREEKSRVFGAGLACLNSFSFHEGNSLNCRAFEIAGAGGLQLAEYRDAIERCFEPGKEILTFGIEEELISLLERAKKEPREMEKIRRAGAARALSHHTYQHRIEEILKVVS